MLLVPSAAFTSWLIVGMPDAAAYAHGKTVNPETVRLMIPLWLESGARVRVNAAPAVPSKGVSTIAVACPTEVAVDGELRSRFSMVPGALLIPVVLLGVVVR